LRRLLRRAIREAYKMGHEEACLAQVARDFIRLYENVYESVKNNEAVIIDEISMEEAKFQKTIIHGMKELEKVTERKSNKNPGVAVVTRPDESLYNLSRIS